MWLEGDGPFTRKAVEYAEQVVAGSIVACLQIRQSCQLFLDDIDGEDWEFRPAAVERVCKFMELLPHSKGTWASKRETLHLEPWQVWPLAAIFGFFNPATGYRKVTEALLLIPRKNGKSTYAAGIANYMAFLDNEAGAEVWIGANSKDQADACFEPCRQMVLRSPQLAEAAGIDVNAKSILQPSTGSFIKSMIAKPGDGSNPHCAILDEAHENDSSEQYDTMKTGMGARTQPLLLTITTAGFNLAGPCRQLQVDAEKVLAGNVRKAAIDHPLYELLRHEPNEWQSSFEFREQFAFHAGLRPALTAAVSTVEETVETVSEEQKSISIKSGRVGAPAIITGRSNWGTELRNYLKTGLNTRAVTTQTGANDGAIGAAGGYLVPEEFDANIVKLAIDVAPLLGEVDVQSTGTPDVKIHVDLAG